MIMLSYQSHQMTWSQVMRSQRKVLEEWHYNNMFYCHIQVHLSGNYVSAVKSPPSIQVHLPWWPPFSQHVLWWYCNHPGILSSIAEILLSNLVFHNGVTPVSVLTLKPPLGVIGVLLLKPWVSPILSICI